MLKRIYKAYLTAKLCFMINRICRENTRKGSKGPLFNYSKIGQAIIKALKK